MSSARECGREDAAAMSGAAGSAELIGAVGLSKRFGPLEVLHGIDLSVREGEVVSIIGPSGSGKSTLLRCLALLEKPSAGRVVMQGGTIATPERDRDAARAARRVRAE